MINKVWDVFVKMSDLIFSIIEAIGDGFGYGIQKLTGGFNKGSEKIVTATTYGRMTKCPKCKSVNVSAVSRGFSKGKAITGGLIFGQLGLLLGLNGGKQRWHCNNCGKEFKR